VMGLEGIGQSGRGQGKRPSDEAELRGHEQPGLGRSAEVPSCSEFVDRIAATEPKGSAAQLGDDDKGDTAVHAATE